LRELTVLFETTPECQLWNCETGDEISIYYKTLRTAMWVCADIERPALVRRSNGSPELMFWIDFSRSWIGAVITLPVEYCLDHAFFTNNVLFSIVDYKDAARPQRIASL
jgi:hypothetical protein